MIQEEDKAKRGTFKGGEWKSNGSVDRSKTKEGGNDYPHLSNFDPIIVMRDTLRKLIRELEVSEDERERLDIFLSGAPGHVLEQIYKQTGLCIRSVERAYWEAKLEEFIDGKPPKYAKHKGDFASAPVFLKEVWGEFIQHGVLYLDRLADYDDKLIPSVRRYWQLHGRAPDDVPLPLPQQKRRGNILEHVAATGPYSVDEVIRAAMAESRARQRHNNLG